MPKTEVRSAQILNATVGRSDLNVATPGEAVVTKIVAGTGITLSGTGADTGTGDVTLNAAGGGGTGDVVGPASAVDTDVVIFNGITGKIIKDSGVLFANMARRDAANTFMAPGASVFRLQQSTQPNLEFYSSSSEVDGKLWRITGNVNGPLTFQALSDNGSGLGLGLPSLSLYRDGSASIGLDLTVNGTGGNVALRNAQNTFLDIQTIESTSPTLILNKTNEAANAKRWNIANTGTLLKFSAYNDAGSLQTDVLSLNRNGDATVVGGLSVVGTTGNVALTNRLNTFVANQQIELSDPALLLRDTSEPANLKVFRVWSSAQLFLVDTLDDAGGFIGRPLTINRAGTATLGGGLNTSGDVNVGTDAAKGNLWTTYPIYPGRYDTGWTKQTTWWLGSHGSYGLYSNTGFYLESAVFTHYVEGRAHIRAATDLYAGGGVFEAGRGTKLGYWSHEGAATYVHGQMTSVTGQYSYTLVGKMMTIVISATGWIPGASVVNCSIAAGCLPAIPCHIPINIQHATKSWHTGMVVFGAGQYYFTIYDELTGAIPAGTAYLYGSLTFPIQ